MMESPFQTVNRVLNEPSNGFDDLRIIARDQKSLTSQERQLIKDAADELETSQKTLIQIYSQLVETQQKLIAVNDQMIAIRGNKLAHFPGLKMTIGKP